MAFRLIESLASTEPLVKLFADDSILRAMLDFEVALAKVESRLGIIPAAAAKSIAAAANLEVFDTAELSRKSLRAGTPSIPLVKALTGLVQANDASAGAFVHWGATSQDVSDTALMLLLKKARSLIEADLVRCENALRTLSEHHKNSVMLGRTLLQPGPPTTFGLKAAGWFGAIRRGRERLSEAFADASVIQFGGAVGLSLFLAIKVPMSRKASPPSSGSDAPMHRGTQTATGLEL